ncbi:MAG: glucose-6-phosphate isomerase [Bdellovibrionaceae bacterium]|nr:glucose-6-phosphate isomerase [Pseudobdellovibrionaceae bacterium]
MWKFLSHSQGFTEKKTVLDAIAAKSFAALLAKEDIGFFNISARREELKRIVSLAHKKREKFQRIAILGIGGSSLGTISLFESLRPDWIEDHKILFFDNVDSKTFYRKLNKVNDLESVLWVLISKSGGTIETLTQAECVREFLQEKGINHFSDNCVVITEEKSNDLYNWAKGQNVEILPVPLDVGGRFSVLTAVGLFPAAFAGLDVEMLLKGAEVCIQDRDFTQNLMSEYWLALENRAHAAYFFSYCDDLKTFGMWIEQLWAESLGKKKTLDGSAATSVAMPIACRGATDQHSVLQQVAHGPQEKVVTFFRVMESESEKQPLAKTFFKATEPLLNKSIGQLLQAEAIATEQALKEENVPAFTLSTATLSEASLGYLFMTFELTVAALGMALNINPFDQPGVERGKVLARSILTQK